MSESRDCIGLGRAGRTLLSAALVTLALARIWGGICAFAGQEWNDVRLRAAWLLRDGLPLYPGFDAGPATTWIYGPVTPVLMLPATLFPGIEGTLITAAILNSLLPAVAIALCCLAWPAPAGVAWTTLRRVLALGLTLLLLPEPFLVFLQTDNAALACGLASLTCLARAAGRGGPLAWLAAAFGAAALFAKWHGVAVLAAGPVWLAMTAGASAALRQLGRCGIAVLAGCALIVQLAASPEAAWQGLLTIPSRLPIIAPGQWMERLSLLAPGLVPLILLPLLVAGHELRRARWRTSGLGLPLMAWAASLPLGLAGTITQGGHYNSLHGAFYLLPVAAVVAVGAADGFRRIAWLVLVGFLACRIGQLALLPMRPEFELVREAHALAAAHGDRLWLPWRPLATRLATGRHDHDEDGLLLRRLAGHPVRGDALRAHLPPAWSGTLLQAHGMNWNVALAASPPGWAASRLGRWLVVSPVVDDSGVGKAPAATHLPR